MLEEHADSGLEFFEGRAVKEGAVDPDFAFCGGFEGVETAQEGGFAASGGADDGDDFALGDCDGNAFEDCVVTKLFN